MARWAPQKHDVLDALAEEILHNYSRGRAVVAIDAAGADASKAFAEDLAAVFAERGVTVERATFDGDLDALRSSVLTPFRAADGDAVLLVDGRFLLEESARGAWNTAVWLNGAPADEEGERYVARVDPRWAAHAIYDVRDPETPRRIFADAC